MFASSITPLVLIGIVVALFVLGVRHFVIRGEALHAISKRKVDDKTLAAINEALVAINEQCHSNKFNADCAGTFSFRGKLFWLVFGYVGSLAWSRFGTTWSFGKSVYALADPQQCEWMKDNPDVFTAAHRGMPYSVFLVRFPALDER